jgi:uncharacterized protein YndB with AHSA1/START domain
MSTETRTALRITRTIKASPERVFEAWTRPEHLERWACPEGGKVLEASVELRVGGGHHLVMKTEEGGIHTAYGVYREIDAPRKLVYTWDWKEEEFRVGETVVTVEFRPASQGTDVVLTHELFPAPEATKAHEEGWISCLNRLERVFD